jgi:hypothetical protein
MSGKFSYVGQKLLMGRGELLRIPNIFPKTIPNDVAGPFLFKKFHSLSCLSLVSLKEIKTGTVFTFYFLVVSPILCNKPE